MYTTSLSRSFIRLGTGALMLALLFSAPLSALAATKSSKGGSGSKLEVSGWIPYWRTEAGTADARKHLDMLSEVNPFGYSVKADGSLSDTLNISQSAWQKLIKDARKEDVRVVPTIMWSDTNAIHTVLSDPASRARHVKAIADMVNKNGFDGVDIDYEGKKAETRVHYSAFLKELAAELDKSKGGEKLLECTIEARMPLSARFSGTPPANIEYANDLPTINKYCDRVRVMTYDQQTADLELNREHAKVLYAPVADVKWVEKVVDYMGKDISKKKMVIGIPTYGYIYQVMPNTSGTGYSYIKLEAFNPRYGTDVAKEYGLAPVRGASGELTLTYVPKDNPASLPSQATLARLAPKGTKSGLLAALGSTALAKSKKQQAPITYLTWSDSVAIKQKVDLAKKLGVKGVAVFKFDGGQDPKMWSVLK